MFDNNGHVFLIEDGKKFQVYIWVLGMKYKLQTVDVGLDYEEANLVAEKTAESLKVPYRRFSVSKELEILGISNVKIIDKEMQIYFDYDGVTYSYDLNSRINLDRSFVKSINFVYNLKVKDMFTKKEENSKDGKYYEKQLKKMNEKVVLFTAVIHRYIKEAK